jgi:predicted O-methyltransferase YrrM
MSVLAHFLKWSVGLAPPETQTTKAERECLARHAQGKKRIAEIGVWYGVSTCVLRSAMSGDGVLFAIDPYDPGRLGVSFHRIIAHWEVGRIANGTVRWIEKTGVEAANDMEIKASSIDFLFIDGDHTFVGLQADWQSWSPLMSLGGIVALHDSRSTPSRPIDDAGSVRFTEKHILPDPQFSLIDEVDSLRVLRRMSF